MVNLWIGGSNPVHGTRSNFHHDFEDNIYALIKGKKKVKLISPADSLKMYSDSRVIHVGPRGFTEHCFSTDAHWSDIEFDFSKTPRKEIDEEFPRFKGVKYMECEFHAGEMLYIPVGWWHEVTSYGHHVALNFWAITEERHP